MELYLGLAPPFSDPPPHTAKKCEHAPPPDQMEQPELYPLLPAAEGNFLRRYHSGTMPALHPASAPPPPPVRAFLLQHYKEAVQQPVSGGQRR